MQIQRQKALAVIDDQAIPFKKQRTGQEDAATVNGCNRRAWGNAEVEALVRALHLAIEYALHAEHIGDLGLDGASEGAFPFPVGAQGLESLRLDFLVPLDLV